MHGREVVRKLKTSVERVLGLQRQIEGRAKAADIAAAWAADDREMIAEAARDMLATIATSRAQGRDLGISEAEVIAEAGRAGVRLAPAAAAARPASHGLASRAELAAAPALSPAPVVKSAPVVAAQVPARLLAPDDDRQDPDVGIGLAARAQAAPVAAPAVAAAPLSLNEQLRERYLADLAQQLRGSPAAHLPILRVLASGVEGVRAPVIDAYVSANSARTLPGTALLGLVDAYRASRPGCTFEEALRAVAKAHPDLYAQHAAGVTVGTGVTVK